MASLIYGNKLPELMCGYRTTINESEIVGVTLEGTDKAKFGDVLIHGSERNAVKVGSVSAATFAGILCATNVKMPRVYPAGQGVDIETEVGEACNLLIRGAIAVKVANGLTIVPGSKACFDDAAKLFTNDTSKVDVGAVFSGKVEIKEKDASGNPTLTLAEIFLKR